ncbi:MAG: nitrate ABC transporter substrate-binding protein, partial [Pseudomonadota bacterium]
MKRWGYVKGDVDYNKVAEQVFLASDCRSIMQGEGYKAPAENYKKHVIMGKTFDPSQPEAYIKSFAIRRTS